MSRKGVNIYKRKDGRWEGRYKSGCSQNGKAIYKSVYAQTYNDCKNKLILIKNELNKGICNNRVTLTVKNLFDEWLEHIAITAKRSTVNTYRIIAENHILPLMSDMPLYKVSSSFLSDIVKNKLNNGRLDGKGGLSAKTVQNIVCVLKAVFSFAEKVHNMRSPADVVPFPKCERKDIEVLTDEEVSTIREYCESKEDYFSVMYELCLATGIRIGELCALQVSDIDFENSILTVQKTVQRVKNNDISVSGNTKVIVTSPKTKSSIRKIPLPTKLLESIKAYISAHNKADGDFIFSAADNKPLDVRTVQKKFTVILKRCGVRKVKFHILRHTFATKWANANFDVKSLSEILGHSSINTTLSLYVHPSVESKRKFIDSLYAA